MIPSVEQSRASKYTTHRTSVEPGDDETKVYKSKFTPLASGKLRSSCRPYYFNIYLWPDQASYETAIDIDPDLVDATMAITLCDTMVDEVTGATVILPKLGEIHFVSGNWDVNTVTHECTHAILHRLRYVGGGPKAVLASTGDTRSDDDPEEEIAYEMGAWVEAALVWLSRVDDNSPYAADLFVR